MDDVAVYDCYAISIYTWLQSNTGDFLYLITIVLPSVLVFQFPRIIAKKIRSFIQISSLLLIYLLLFSPLAELGFIPMFFRTTTRNFSSLL